MKLAALEKQAKEQDSKREFDNLQALNAEMKSEAAAVQLFGLSFSPMFLTFFI